MNGQLNISRRMLLQGGGAVIVGFALYPAFASHAQDAADAKPVVLNEVDSFLAIDSQGLATIYSGKVDIGTGLKTAFTQIAAEELDLPLESVTILQGDTLLTPDQGPTSGSNSVQKGRHADPAGGGSGKARPA
jgi:nicotinate dehydrogenase subunit B